MTPSLIFALSNNPDGFFRQSRIPCTPEFRRQFALIYRISVFKWGKSCIRKNPAIGDPLNRLSLAPKGQVGEGEVIGFHSCVYSLLLLVSLLFIFTLLLKRRVSLMSPQQETCFIPSADYKPVIKESILPSYKRNTPPKRKSGIINFSQSTGDVYLSYMIQR